MLWQDIHGTLHLVFDTQTVCRVQKYESSEICQTCLEIYQVAALQLKVIWQNKQAQSERLEKQSLREPTLSVSSVEEKTLVLDSRFTIVNLGEWVEQRKKKLTMQPISSFYAVQEQQDVTVG